jgi:hypothetical protein
MEAKLRDSRCADNGFGGPAFERESRQDRVLAEIYEQIKNNALEL